MSEIILKRVKIEGFKSIRNVDLALKPLNILIGANGSGKSNFINAFKFLHELVDQNLQFFVAKSGGANTFLHFGQQVTEKLKLYFEFGNEIDGNLYECALISTLDEKFIFENESVSYHNLKNYPIPYTKLLGRGHIESLLTENEEIAEYVVLRIKFWKIYHFHDTSDTAKMKKSVAIDDNKSLKEDGSNLSAYLYLLHEQEKPYYDNIVDTIRLVAPFFKDFDLHPNQLDESKIKLEWQEKGSDAYFDANAFSDGTLRFICLATLLLQPIDKMPQVIILDEPELGLHPYAINILAGLLHSAAKQTQIIASTQSVTLVNQFEPDDIIVVERRGGESIFKRLSEDEIDNWLDDYSLGDLWEKNIIGGRPTL